MTKIVDVIRPGSLKKTIGPTGTIKRIINNREFFLKKGYDITVFTHDVFAKERNFDLRKDDVNKRSSIRLKISYRLRELAKKSRLLAAIYIIRDYFKVKKLVTYYIKLERNPDVVVFHSVFECFQFINKVKRPVKTVLFFHTDGIPLKMLEIYYPKLKDTIVFKKLYNMEVSSIKNVDHIVFITKIGRENFLKHHPFVDVNKTSLIINGIDDTVTVFNNLQIPINERIDFFKYKLCCTGTINERKGQRIIIEALKRVDYRVLKDIHLTLIGDGPDKYMLERLVQEYNLEKNVSFAGKVANEKVPLYLKRTDIFILMSYNEGLPISIIEAMRTGLPIISTNVSGIPEVVTENLNGLLLDPNVDQLVDLLNNIDKYNWSEMGKASLSEFKTKFTFDRMKVEYCEMLDKLFVTE
jgi:glycosyltransferase involved in cell wall biosynthesis